MNLNGFAIASLLVDDILWYSGGAGRKRVPGYEGF